MSKNRSKGIAGWEKWGSTTYLRVDLAEPEPTEVWPCLGSIDEPQSEWRRLTQKAIPLSDVRRALQDAGIAKSEGYGPGDVALMKEALESEPRRYAVRRDEEQKPKISPAPGLPLGM